MNAQLKRLAVYSLQKLGYYRRLHVSQRNVYKILCYHRFLAEGGSSEISKKYIHSGELRSQLAFVQKRFNILSLEECIGHYRQYAVWPDEAISVTIDDGYEDIYHYAYPLFKEKNISATVFLVYDFIEHRSWLWQDKIKYILRKTQLDGIDKDPVFGDLNFDTYENMLIGQLRIYNRMLTLPPDQRARLIEQLAGKCEVALPDEPPAEYAPLSWAQIHEMAGNGIRFGAHTLSHEVLTSLSNADLKKEVEVSKQRIEARIGREVETFCYPHGQYSERELIAVRKAGFLAAVAGVGGNLADADLFRLYRLYVSKNYLSAFINSLYRF